MQVKNIHARLQGLKEDLKNSISKFKQPPKLADKLNPEQRKRAYFVHLHLV